MTLARSVGVALVAVAAVSGCGGGHPVSSGQSDAASACRGAGSAAALAATRAAAVNPSYATLAADENAVAASESTQVTDLSDGTATDDAGAGALAASLDLGSAARQKVIADCVALGLPVTHS
jgi:hypothetical protein